MPKPPDTTKGAGRYKKPSESIVSPATTETQVFSLSPSRSPQPPLPDHLDALLDAEWSREASLQLDSWLWYFTDEFELAGRHQP